MRQSTLARFLLGGGAVFLGIAAQFAHHNRIVTAATMFGVYLLALVILINIEQLGR